MTFGLEKYGWRWNEKINDVSHQFIRSNVLSLHYISDMSTCIGKILLAFLLPLAPLTAGSAGSTTQGRLETGRYVYTGGVCDGKQNGYGVCRYHNGNTYYGYWKMGYKDGLGRMVFADGTMDFGRWRQGTLPKNRNKKFKVGKEGIWY